MTLWKGFQQPKRLEIDSETLTSDLRKVLRPAVRARLRHHDRQRAAARPAVVDRGRGHHRGQDRGRAPRVLVAAGRRRGRDGHHPEPQADPASSCTPTTTKILTLDMSSARARSRRRDLQGDSAIEILDPDAPIATLVGERPAPAGDARVARAAATSRPTRTSTTTWASATSRSTRSTRPVRRVQLPRRGGPHRPGDRLRPPRPRGLDERHDHADRRRRPGRDAPARPPRDLHQRRARDGARGRRRGRAAGEPGGVPQQVGRRARALGPQRELPEERRHPHDPRPRAAHREGHARDQELRPQVPRTRSRTSCAPWACPSAWSSSRSKRRASKSCSTTVRGASSVARRRTGWRCSRTSSIRS